MKSSLIKQLPLAMLLGATLIGTRVAAAAEETEAKVTIPATAGGIWQAIDGHIAELHSALTNGKLDGIHAHAYAVRDLVRALPTHSPNLPADALAKVKGESKFVDTLAERLDHTGDANDKVGTQANLQKLEGVLKLVRAQYPASK
jgi:hypothetical protein